MGEGRPEVGVPLAHEHQRLFARGVGEAPATGAPPPARRETRGAVRGERIVQPSNLPLAQPQELRGPAPGEPALGDPRQYLQAIQFLHAQRDLSRHPATVDEKRTSLLWRNGHLHLGPTGEVYRSCVTDPGPLKAPSSRGADNAQSDAWRSTFGEIR